LPGTTSPEVEAIERAAEAYVTIRDQRMALNQEEVQLREALLKAMEDADVETYTRGAFKIWIDVTKKPKIKVDDEPPVEEE
jgi:aspartate/methionine/tyrosine aminotransferase